MRIESRSTNCQVLHVAALDKVTIEPYVKHGEAEDWNDGWLVSVRVPQCEGGVRLSAGTTHECKATIWPTMQPVAGVFTFEVLTQGGLRADSMGNMQVEVTAQIPTYSRVADACTWKRRSTSHSKVHIGPVQGHNIAGGTGKRVLRR